MKAPRNLPFLLKVYFILGSIVLVMLALYYNGTLMERMRTRSESTTRLFSRFIAIELSEVKDKKKYDFISEILDDINLPSVLTDAAGRPVVWSRIGIQQLDKMGRLLDFDPAAPNDPLLKKVLDKSLSFDRINEPIRIEADDTYLDLHYGQSKLTRELAVAPYIQLAVFVLFMLFGFLGFRVMKTGEQRSIWVGMAKEAAHQLGTPLSSIMGWVEIIRDESKEAGCSGKLSNG
ncbi:MAG: hypothetical protein KAX38_02765, partial [Candidatus Krumholzibacteria bacterium]|nr:hypothetical protein [Candidatus Krumholzibacteria bacterium]